MTTQPDEPLGDVTLVQASDDLSVELGESALGWSAAVAIDVVTADVETPR